LARLVAVVVPGCRLFRHVGGEEMMDIAIYMLAGIGAAVLIILFVCSSDWGFKLFSRKRTRHVPQIDLGHVAHRPYTVDDYHRMPTYRGTIGPRVRVQLRITKADIDKMRAEQDAINALHDTY
jgi:hypothetical protein